MDNKFMDKRKEQLKNQKLDEKSKENAIINAGYAYYFVDNLMTNHGLSYENAVIMLSATITSSNDNNDD